ncbi:hypothetical protein [Actinopolymorpha alba]|uniref:hypothetical protein n=1 Tax=Actinopolymorpha alba TaxID=533267 RepID=UPI000369B18E|nr:hypothetical protein [Actinopolymorpha alba]
MNAIAASSVRLDAIALAASPGVWLAGWAVMRVEGQPQPGLGWTLAHLLWTVAFVLFAFASVALYRMLGTREVVARAALGAALVGAVALIGQMLIDLGVGLQSGNRTAMRENYARVFDVPGVELIFFIAGPVLLFVGLLALSVLAGVRQVVSGWSVAVLAFGIALMVAGRELDGWLRGLEGLGGLGLWLALVVMARGRSRSRSRSS